MFLNCDDLGHIFLECKKSFYSDAINYLKYLLHKQFTHYDNRNNGGEGSGQRRQNDTRIQKSYDSHQGNGSRNENGGGNGNDNDGNQPNNTKLVNVPKDLKVTPNKGGPRTNNNEGHGEMKWLGTDDTWKKLDKSSPSGGNNYTSGNGNTIHSNPSDNSFITVNKPNKGSEKNIGCENAPHF